MNHHNWMLVPMLILGLLVSGQSLDAQDPGYIFHFDTGDTGPSGSNILVPALLDNPGGNLAGWSISVCQDDNIDVVSIENGTAPLTGNAGGPADFIESTVFPGFGLRQGVVIHFVGLNELPVNVDHQMLIIEYQLLGPDDTFAEISCCDVLFPGDTSVSETLAVAPGGVAIVPTIEPGLVEIGGLPPFSLSAATNLSEVEQGNPVDAIISVDAPVPSYGFSLGFAHSGSSLTLQSAEAGSALNDLNGGDGPDYLTIDIDPEGADGLIVACLVSLDSDLGTLPAANQQELVVAHYEANDTAPLGTTSLNFSEELVPQSPSPATAIIFSLGSTSAVVLTSGATVEIIEGVVGVQFTRGDFDANGGVNLGDPINLLEYMFNSGAEPSCLKIGDIDDNGSIALGDPIILLSYLFSGGPPPAEPFDSCGIDPNEDDLTCESFDACP
ncbi:MAG: hypothetical protein AAEJ04_08495 [Planctomycetota bacterium]